MILALLALVVAGPSFSCRVASVHDGDTLRCVDGVRVRLAGIDANELDNRCHTICAQLSADRARARLEALAHGQTLSCRPTGRSYRRIVAWCSIHVSGRPVDLSCAQVETGAAIIWRRFDPTHRLDRCGPGLPPLVVAP